MTIEPRWPAPIVSTDTAKRMNLKDTKPFKVEDITKAPAWYHLLMWLLDNDQDPTFMLTQVPIEVRPDIERYIAWQNKPRINKELINQWRSASREKKVDDIW
jgi:hypothetical protein